MSILMCVAGDVAPQERTISLFKEKNNEYLFGELMPIINTCDIKVVNFEAPIIYGEPTPIRKIGPSLHTTAETAATLQQAGFNVFTLANNHFRDQGENGVSTTLNVCEDLGIKYVGGGRNIEQARRVLFLKQKGAIISIINACESEFSIASNEYGGSNAIDIISLCEDIYYAKQKADYIVVILHGGIERYPYPTPRMKRLYRHIIDLGADVVVNGHQHCFSGYEVYKDKPIFYGIGNFCFDRVGERHNSWNQGYMVLIELEIGESQLKSDISFKIIPYEQCNDEPKLSLCPDDYYFQRIKHLNTIISDDYLLAQALTDYVLNNEKNLLRNMLPTNNRYIKGLYGRGLIGKVFHPKQLLRMKNLFTCEAHCDVMKHLFTILSASGQVSEVHTELN